MVIPGMAKVIDAIGPASWLKTGIAALAVAGLCLPLGYCKGERTAKAHYEAARAVANVETMKVDGASKEVAANERRVTDALINEHKQELTNAVADLPDEIPSPRRVALACARLRSQGTDTAALPACGGLGGAAKAPAKP